MELDVDPIKAKYFYANENEKIKLNWFCYEYAFGLYTKIRENPFLKSYRKSYSQKEIVEFCVYFSKTMKKSIYERLSGMTEATMFYEDYVEWYYPKMKEPERLRILRTAMESFDELTASCVNCPVRCISEMHESCELFDRLDEDGYMQ